MPTPLTLTDGDLSSLIDDAKRLQLAMLPRPRSVSPRVIDLTATPISIPASAASFAGDLDPYGA